jgi:hypothetical protein
MSKINPSYYKKGNIECADVTELFNFCRGNVIKYIWRNKDENPLIDLGKALWYLEREINNVAKANNAIVIKNNETLLVKESQVDAILLNTADYTAEKIFHAKLLAELKDQADKPLGVTSCLELIFDESQLNEDVIKLVYLD